MESQNNTVGQTQRPTADQYLSSVVKTAEWIDVQYKKFSLKFKNSPLAMRELYLCACDEVPIELLIEAANHEPIEKSLSLCRRKHIESQILGSYSDELEEIRNITSVLGKDVKNMSGTVQHIADNIPSFDEMFPVTSPPIIGREIDNTEREDSVITESVTSKRAIEKIPVDMKAKNIDKKGILSKLKDKVSDLFPRVKNNPVAFIVELYSKGYSDEQINFIIDCIENGLNEKEIKEFASPKISVDMMKKLRDLQIREREDKKNG